MLTVLSSQCIEIDNPSYGMDNEEDPSCDEATIEGIEKFCTNLFGKVLLLL